MPLALEENIKDLPEDFNWGEGWRALRIWKELRDDGEFLYAFLIKMYGPNDYGNKREDELWIGRKIKYLKGRKWQLNPKKPNFGKRVDDEPETVKESIWNDETGTYDEVITPINAQKTYEYIHKTTDKDIMAKYKTLVGSTTQGRTRFYFVYDNGARIVNIKNSNDFWNLTVEQLAKQEVEGVSLTDTAQQKIARGSRPEHT